jgi:RimJ/RimL family protein N-acetyltransferase
MRRWQAFARKGWAFLQPRSIDLLLYSVSVPDYQTDVAAKTHLTIDEQSAAGHTLYSGQIDGQTVHKSYLYDRVLLLDQFGYRGFPVIGNCSTLPEFRGLRIYPHVMNHIITACRTAQTTELIYILVAPDNIASIKGIERVGFQFVGRLQGRRIGPLLLNRAITTEYPMLEPHAP